MYTACPISDAEVNTSRPSLVIDELSSEEVTFYTGLPNKETFYLLFEHIMSNRKISDRDVDEFFMVLMRLRISTCSKIFNEWLALMYEHLNFLVS